MPINFIAVRTWDCPSCVCVVTELWISLLAIYCTYYIYVRKFVVWRNIYIVHTNHTIVFTLYTYSAGRQFHYRPSMDWHINEWDIHVYYKKSPAHYLHQCIFHLLQRNISMCCLINQPVIMLFCLATLWTTLTAKNNPYADLAGLHSSRRSSPVQSWKVN